MTVKRRPRSTEAVARERGKQKEMDAPRVVAVQVERVFAEKHRTFSPSRAGARAARTGGTPIAADQSEKCPFASRKELTKLLRAKGISHYHQICTGTAIDRVRQTEKESDKKYDDVPGARARARRAASVPEGHLQHL